MIYLRAIELAELSFSSVSNPAARLTNKQHNKALHPTAYSFARRSSSLRFRRRVSLAVLSGARGLVACVIAFDNLQATNGVSDFLLERQRL